MMKKRINVIIFFTVILLFFTFLFLKYLLLEIDVSLKYEEWNKKMHTERKERILSLLMTIKFLIVILIFTPFLLKLLSRIKNRLSYEKNSF